MAEREPVINPCGSPAESAGPMSSQGMHVSQKVLDLLLAKDLAEALHFASTKADDLADAFVIRWQSADGKVRLLENTFHTWSFLAARGVGLVATIAIIVVDAATGGFLRVEAEFSVALAALDRAGG